MIEGMERLGFDLTHVAMALTEVYGTGHGLSQV